MEKVSVLLASPNKTLRQSLERVLGHEDWIQVVGVSASKVDALDMAKTLAPQVVVVDLELEGDGLETGRQILEVSPDAKIIVLSPYDYVGQVTVKESPIEPATAIESVDWLSKKSSLADLLKTISATEKRRRVH
ncbi:MAG: response regulator transcription factor [Actinomycetota bacterium]|nr:response regulator transcription factor [Actinomycetota bacterium]